MSCYISIGAEELRKTIGITKLENLLSKSKCIALRITFVKTTQNYTTN